MFRLGYNTNGLAHHRVLDALRLLAELGYEGVAITPDVGTLDPLGPDLGVLADTRRWAEELGLDLTIETGARFVLDARRKHFPSLLEEQASDRQRRIDFLIRSIELAVALGAPLVSLWAGVAPGDERADAREGEASSGGGGDREPIWERLVDSLRAVLAHARERGIQVAFEPEPGMFIERPAGYLELIERLGSDGEGLGLCLDVGHLLVTGDLPVEEQIRELAPRLVHVHLDDIRGGVHEHCMFGDGELDLSATLAALVEVGFDGMAAVELSRDSHRGPWAAREALRRLREALS